MKARLEADREQIARFVDTLFRHAPDGTYVSLRCFYDKGEERDDLPYPPEPVLIEIDKMRLIERASLYATHCANHPRRVVFCPPVATFRTGQNAKTENLAASLAISVECDVHPNLAVDTLTMIIGEPTLVMASGGEWTNPESGEVEQKLHAHWRLSEAATIAAEHEKVKLARRLACAIVRSDATANALVHPLRWAGSWHRKKDPARMAKIITLTEAEVVLDNVLAKLAEVAIDRGLASYCDDTRALDAGNDNKLADVSDVAIWMRGIPNPRPEISAENKDATFEWWNRIGMALWAATAGSDAGLALFQEWSAKYARYDTEFHRNSVDRRWRHYFRYPPRGGPTGLGAGTLYYFFNEYWSQADFNAAGDEEYDDLNENSHG